MTITIDLATEAEARLQRKPPRLSRPTEPPAWLTDLKPRDPAYADKNGFAHIVGKWPGDESDEAVAAALEKMS